MKIGFNVGDRVRVRPLGISPGRVGRVMRIGKNRCTHAPVAWIQFEEGGPEYAYYPNQLQKLEPEGPNLFDGM